MTVFQHTYIVVVVNKHFQAFKKELSSEEYMQIGVRQPQLSQFINDS